MSEDQEDSAKSSWLADNYFVSRREYDLTHRNVEERLNGLKGKVESHDTQLETLDRVMNRLEAEQFEIHRRMDILIQDNKDAKTERFELLLVCQGLQTDVQNFLTDVSPGLKNRVTLAGIVIFILLSISLLKDLILPVVLRALGL